jgi:hypothetical protein
VHAEVCSKTCLTLPTLLEMAMFQQPTTACVIERR